MLRVCPSRERFRESQLAICWKLRASGATAKSGDNASGADNQQERPSGRCGQGESSETTRQPLGTLREVKIWSEPHGDMRRTRAKFLVG